jgi:hypothetical protein
MQGKDLEPHNSEEYALMLTLEQLESLEEELQEVGFGTLSEIETALALTSHTSTPKLEQRRELLQDIRNQMHELQVTNFEEIKEHITKLNEQLDEI